MLESGNGGQKARQYVLINNLIKEYYLFDFDSITKLSLSNLVQDFKELQHLSFFPPQPRGPALKRVAYGLRRLSRL